MKIFKGFQLEKGLRINILDILATLAADDWIENETDVLFFT